MTMSLVYLKSVRFRKDSDWKTQKAEAYSESFQTSKMELSVKTANGWEPLTIFVKSFILDLLKGVEYAFKKLCNFLLCRDISFWFYILNITLLETPIFMKISSHTTTLSLLWPPHFMIRKMNK